MAQERHVDRMDWPALREYVRVEIYSVKMLDLRWDYGLVVLLDRVQAVRSPVPTRALRINVSFSNNLSVMELLAVVRPLLPRILIFRVR